MRPMELLAVIRRNLPLVFIGVLLTALAEAALVFQVGPAYAASAKVVLLPPRSSISAADNPLLFLDGLQPVEGVLYAHLVSKDVVDRIVGEGDARYTLNRDPFSSAPILVVTVTAPSRTEVTQVLKMVMSEIPTGLASVQERAGIAPEDQITSLALVPPQHPGKVWSALLRMAIAVAGVMAVLTLLLVVTIDALRAGRRERQALRMALGEAKIPLRR